MQCVVSCSTNLMCGSKAKKGDQMVDIYTQTHTYKKLTWWVRVPCGSFSCAAERVLGQRMSHVWRL